MNPGSIPGQVPLQVYPELVVGYSSTPAGRQVLIANHQSL